MKKRTLVTVIALVLALVMSVAGTLAYLTSTDEDVNVMTLGDVKIDQRENGLSVDGFPEQPIYPSHYDTIEDTDGDHMWDTIQGDLDKVVTVENIGSSDAYVRTWFAFEAADMDYSTFKESILLNTNTNPTDYEWTWIETPQDIDGVNYILAVATYKEVLKPGEETSPSLYQVALDKSVGSELVEQLGDQYHILVVSQAVQTENMPNASTALIAAFDEPIAPNHPFTNMVAEDEAEKEAEEEYNRTHPFEVNSVRYPTLPEAVEAASDGDTVYCFADAVLSESLTIDKNITIDGNNNSILRANGFKKFILIVDSGKELSLTEAIVDGGAIWSGEIDATLQRGTTNTGVTAENSLIDVVGTGKLNLNSGTVLQNNDGASAVNIQTRGGGSLTLNGAQIINNASAGGSAIWGGGNITINEGSKVNGNYASEIGGAVRMVNGYNNITFTMNGGEMNHNKSAGNGGALWGGNNATYIFTGGEVAYNEAQAGGAIWTGNYERYTFSGDFALHDNKATTLGGAIRFSDHASLTMTGGSVYNNTLAGESDAFYLNNNTATITGGSISDDFAYSGGLGLTIGDVTMTGKIHYNLSTNHNTAYLAVPFKGFEFSFNEDNTNFSKFNFKPAYGYTYTTGDENKLVCLNDGYTVVWDDTTSTFRLEEE